MRTTSSTQHFALLLILSALFAAVGWTEEPSAAATEGFYAYAARLEGRLAQQHRAQAGFVAPVGGFQLRQGAPVIEQLVSAADAELPGALLHHWRGTAFVPGAKAADFERLMKDFGAYPRVYAPQVLSARVLAQQGDRLQATMRVRQKHILTVVMDTAYDVSFGRPDPLRSYSISRSTRITEIADAGTQKERALSGSEQHGFLWRMNTYWSAEERDGGLYIQIESLTLTRGIPHGLGWVIGPFVQSIPRESLEFTLRSTMAALARRN